MEKMNEEQPENRLEMDDELYNACLSGSLERLKNTLPDNPIS